jgi:hypothetical protein
VTPYPDLMALNFALGWYRNRLQEHAGLDFAIDSRGLGPQGFAKGSVKWMNVLRLPRKTGTETMIQREAGYRRVRKLSWRIQVVNKQMLHSVGRR